MGDQLDARVFDGLKDAIRKADKAYKNRMNHYTWKFPVILVDFNEWDVHYFEDEYLAREHVSKVCNQWDDEPPNEEQEDMIILKFITETRAQEFPHTHKGARFHKEINGERIYVQKSLVYCEPELSIRVTI